MKKLLLTTTLCAIVTLPANAVQKCVALTSSTTCESSTGGIMVTATYGVPDWSGSCTNGISISGIANCGSQSASVGTTKTTIQISTTSTNNKYCWCKMISPAVSPWVYRHVYADYATCLKQCNQLCATSLYNTPAYTNAMYSNMSD